MGRLMTVASLLPRLARETMRAIPQSIPDPFPMNPARPVPAYDGVVLRAAVPAQRRPLRKRATVTVLGFRSFHRMKANHVSLGIIDESNEAVLADGLLVFLDSSAVLNGARRLL